MRKATGAATGNVTEVTTQANCQTKILTTGRTITFGSLTFSIDHEDLLAHPYNIPSGKEKENQPITLHRDVPANYKNKPSGMLIHTSTQKKLTSNPDKNKQTKEKTLLSKQVSTAQRFVKVPLATTEWQRAVKKSQPSKKLVKKCFYCHKEGHIQKFCWSKIKCHGCGRIGHKWAKCLFKASIGSSKQTKQKHPIKGKQHTAQMELIQGRPPLAEVYRPQRQNLTEENEYLHRVGLLVLIRGFPTPDLPQLVTEKLIEVHGGHPEDYVVTQATITPFIITCPSTAIRDELVRGGIYSIPQLEMQFKIYEWRPRFGLGYDPPTHQIWVKLVGLPLQAWTQQEVTAILQQFGYPMQILPFGQAAGHHRDVSALIATTHPTRIPLACRYREGDYSTQFDVVILSWRLWDDTHFPPSDHPLAQENPHHQPPLQDNQIAAGHHSSSSSSSNVPSEPTVDLSAWSPRSCNLGLKAGKKWIPVRGSSQPNTKSQGRDNAAAHFPPQPHHPSTLFSDKLALSTANQSLHCSLNLRLGLHLATKNPTLLHESQWNPPPKKSHPLSFPPPIHITLTHSSLLVEHQCRCTLGVAQQAHATAHATATPHDAPPLPSTTHMPLSLPKSYKPPVLMVLQALLQEYSRLASSPFRPNLLSPFSKPIILLPLWERSNMTPSQKTAHEQISQTTLLIPSDISSNKGNPQAVVTQAPCGSLQTHQREEQLPLRPPGFEFAISDLNPNQKDPELKEISEITQQSTPPTPLTTKTSCAMGLTKAPKDTPQKGKKKTVPTRRSQRIQAKQPTSAVTPSPSTKPKSKINKLPFDPNSCEPPLDANTTLAILQASGLHITKEVEDIINEAVRKGNHKDAEQDPRPPTPLHDLTPPRSIPGCDLML